MPLRFTPLPRAEVVYVQHLTLPPQQERYVAPIAEMTDEPDKLQDFHAVWADQTAVGFFKIDRDFSRTIASLPPAAHALRGLLIGGQFQGRGLGAETLAGLGDYIAREYNIPELWLSVDADNDVATQLYRKYGWHNVGAPIAGRVGPEQVMRLTLTDCLSTRDD